MLHRPDPTPASRLSRQTRLQQHFGGDRWAPRRCLPAAPTADRYLRRTTPPSTPPRSSYSSLASSSVKLCRSERRHRFKRLPLQGGRWWCRRHGVMADATSLNAANAREGDSVTVTAYQEFDQPYCGGRHQHCRWAWFRSVAPTPTNDRLWMNAPPWKRRGIFISKYSIL